MLRRLSDYKRRVCDCVMLMLQLCSDLRSVSVCVCVCVLDIKLLMELKWNG